MLAVGRHDTDLGQRVIRGVVRLVVQFDHRVGVVYGAAWIAHRSHPILDARDLRVVMNGVSFFRGGAVGGFFVDD